MNGQWKRFSNRAQLIRHIHEETGTPAGELWDSFEEQYDS